MMGFIRALAVSIFAAFIVVSSATAQTYPNRPIMMLVAFPPGGADAATVTIASSIMVTAVVTVMLRCETSHTLGIQR